jgi:hypothetical protein
MKTTRFFLLALLVFIIQTAHAVPPFSGTIFIDPDIITAADPTTFTNITYTGQGIRNMYDRRCNCFSNANAFLFNARYNDGFTVEVQVNPEFTNSTMAMMDATKYATVIGRLPTTSRSLVQTVWIHKGVYGFGGGNNNLLIHTGQADLYEADGILEETFVHESSHTSLDPTNAAAPGWLAAQTADPDFISTYARDNPTREDVAESFLTWLAIRHRSGRISSTLSNTIATTIPNRHAYFDQLSLELYPILPAFAPTAVVTATNVSARSATLRADINPGNLTTTAFFVFGSGNVATPKQTNTTRQSYTIAVPMYDLIPGSNYQFHVVASNRLGLIVGSTVNFTTLADVSGIEASVPGDTIAATSANSPVTQTAPNAIDNNVTNKYLNFDKLNTGFTVTLSGNLPVRAITLISAEDAPERDPSSFVIEGSSNGVVFTRIASNAVPPFPTRHFIQSFALPGTNDFNVYRVLFPTVSNAVTANSMQIAEVELLYYGEITSPGDAVNITLPAGAVDVRGVGALFDRQLDDIRKLEVAPIAGGNTVVNLVPAAGATLLKGFELIGAADDFTYPQRRPSTVTVAGSNDGISYTTIAMVTPAAPSFNMQIQEFPVSSNTTAWLRYRVTFGPPVGGDRLQVGEMRLFGETVPALAIRSSGANVLLSWTNQPGYSLQSIAALPGGSWITVGTAPVLANGTNTVTLIRSEKASFFRLRK